MAFKKSGVSFEEPGSFRLIHSRTVLPGRTEEEPSSGFTFSLQGSLTSFYVTDDPPKISQEKGVEKFIHTKI